MTGLLPTSWASSQELSLFGEFENDTANSSGAGVSEPDSGETRVTNQNATFILVGVTRIGSNQRVHLKHASGETVSVELNKNDSSPVPGYESFAVLSAQHDNAVLRYPGNVPCQASPDKGISCRNNSTADLSLSLGSVIREQEVNPDEAIEQVDTPPDNPFARIRAANAADNPASDPNSQRFRPRRIPPEDVPEGMRVISTPFGDRLVQE